MAIKSGCRSCGNHSSDGEECSVCGFPIRTWLEFLNGFSQRNNATNHSATVPIATRLPVSRIAKTIDLGPTTSILVGNIGHESRDGFQQVILQHQAIAPIHALILPGRNEHWLVGTSGNEESVFLNGNPVTAHVLSDSDTVQIGPFAWQYQAKLKVLREVVPIPGRPLEIRASVPGRLGLTELFIPAGQATAITGPSGCGKSTLLGFITSVGKSTNQPADVYYLPQKDLVHDDLRLKESLCFVARFYGKQEILPADIETALRLVGLPGGYEDRFPNELSGGELRRFRIAQAVISSKGIIVLDEPDSGLDHETAEEIAKLLRSLALRGATVVAITHHRHVLSQFDRVIELEKGPDGGRIVNDSRPANVSGIEDEHSPYHRHPASENSSPNRIFRQLAILVWREFRSLTSPRLFGKSNGLGRFLPGCLVPLLLIPVVFALAISLSVPTDPVRNVAEKNFGKAFPIARLGFLSVVSVVWMASSLGHLAFARKRELYDHENSIGVSYMHLLSAKGLVLSGAAILQAIVLFVILMVLREWILDRSSFVIERLGQIFEILACLSLVAVAGTALGLLVSVIANRNALVAASILPLVMMVQILFSLSVTILNPHTSYMRDYEQLSWNTDSELAPNDELPLRLTARLSYATLTRFGDQWLNSFSTSTEPIGNYQKYRRQALFGLVGWTVFYHSSCCLFLLFFQRRRR